MHKEVDRIYELNEYLRFHSRSFKKLVKLKPDVPKNEQDDPVWNQMSDSIDDLEQYGYYLDSLKERFNNLIELEFNIENATQCMCNPSRILYSMDFTNLYPVADNSRFLSILGTLFLPVSFLAVSISLPSILPYLPYLAIPSLPFASFPPISQSDRTSTHSRSSE